jgi:uncharacterized protein (TIGR02001 family)
VTALAGIRGSRAGGSALRLFFASASLCTAAPAAAEVGATVSFFTDSRFRGYSLSAGHPVAVGDLSFDEGSGLYGAVSGSLVLGSGDGVRPLGLQLNGGYATRVSPDLTLDLGAVHSSYTRYTSSGSARSSTEFYAGIVHKYVAGRIAFSPHYFEPGARILYGELNSNISPMHKVHVEAHAGLLVPLHYHGPDDPRTQYDWRLGVARDLGPLSLHAILTGGGPGRDYYRGHWHSRNALIVGISCAL